MSHQLLLMEKALQRCLRACKNLQRMSAQNTLQGGKRVALYLCEYCLKEG